jgi:hypothetical protein
MPTLVVFLTEKGRQSAASLPCRCHSRGGTARCGSARPVRHSAAVTLTREDSCAGFVRQHNEKEAAIFNFTKVGIFFLPFLSNESGTEFELLLDIGSGRIFYIFYSYVTYSNKKFLLR